VLSLSCLVVRNSAENAATIAVTDHNAIFVVAEIAIDAADPLDSLYRVTSPMPNWML
jgi:hypothetical protein